MDCNLKTPKTTVNLGGKEYTLAFTLNVIADLQEKFQKPIDDIINSMDDEIKDLSVIRGILTAMINEGLDIDGDETGTYEKHLTERQVGRMNFNIGDITQQMTVAIIESTPESEEDPLTHSEQ